ncbi:uncharacterized protein LAESUDRAFT_816775 [Laetiporus sulphureus 93-53]|uniref:Uncharacterized protein n=1 Tax=Laetiporus sulphureus 93-53 TaxID=1314785 RepID=A0A165AZG8_9APHY|nr:uncharacterized protein LAESUDRAFT_816775 [Laetiporus sulphureus 93-53]KZS99943.1 hypothetical protein LAESUDRAFT_816775 [Laetiporus sulphureus 93-53]
MSSTELSATDLQSILQFTISLTRSAGEIILQGSQAILSSGNVNEQKNPVDLVTEYNVKVESFIGEESYAAGARPFLTDEATFCVNPIGAFVRLSTLHVRTSSNAMVNRTTNFTPVLGVIYNPFLGRLYAGVLKGQRSYLVHGKRAPVKLPIAKPRPLPSLSQALIGAERGSDHSEDVIRTKGDSFKRLAGNPAKVVKGAKWH